MATCNEDHNDCGDDALARLIAAHPTLFRGEEPRVTSHLPAGWYGIVDRLCTDLERILDARAPQFSIAQIKEKFGSLRFYWDLDGEPSPLFADVLGSLPADIALATFPTDSGTEVVIAATAVGTRISIRGTDALSRAVATRVTDAEMESARTCLTCGQPGRLWMDGWLHVACDHHKRPDAVAPEMYRRGKR
jgi:hypothetical protein